MISNSTLQIPGLLAEKIAYDYLVSRGLEGLYQNYRSRFGEIDLIMMHDDILVFIEVRHRTDTRLMDPVETITASKISKIVMTSQYFLQNHRSIRNQVRFDIITLTGELDSPEINWLKNAFNG